MARTDLQPILLSTWGYRDLPAGPVVVALVEKKIVQSNLKCWALKIVMWRIEY